ncbi:stress-induced protein [Pantoea rodasii]|uniref:Stress-induced protein n=1 Tax=Pantoea rodasii TaxID=1076549 RepID=A0A2M9W6R9_9GAMM|nr:general stress protein [Pantoea rodasii]ORM62765.1 stress-induced protein [Pantoea rodasii]PJZ03198.1 stress-induced protein [Pantoea rodasii]
MTDPNKHPEEEEKKTQRRGGTGNFAEDKDRAAEAGRKGGQVSGGNFKNDPNRAVEAGRKGGKISRRK